MYVATKHLLGNIEEATGIAGAGELARTMGAAGSTIFPTARLEYLYEMSFLRVFIAWESFLEETFVRCLCGKLPLSPGAQLIFNAYTALEDAQIAVLAGHPFFPWADPDRVRELSKKFIRPDLPGGTNRGQFYDVLTSNIARLRALKQIRNYIAHGSDSSRVEFQKATLLVAGASYSRLSAGKFLRDGVPASTLQTRLEALASELVSLAVQIAP